MISISHVLSRSQVVSISLLFHSMTGLLLVLLGAFSAEVGATIGKREVKKGTESVYMMGFLDAMWGVLLYVFLILSGAPWWGTSVWSASWTGRPLPKLERARGPLST